MEQCPQCDLKVWQRCRCEIGELGCRNGHRWIWCHLCRHSVMLNPNHPTHAVKLRALVRHSVNKDNHVNGQYIDAEMDKRNHLNNREKSNWLRENACICHPTFTVKPTRPTPPPPTRTQPTNQKRDNNKDDFMDGTDWRPSKQPRICPVCKSQAVARCECDIGELVCPSGHRWFLCPAHAKIRIIRETERESMHKKRGSENILHRMRVCTIQEEPYETIWPCWCHPSYTDGIQNDDNDDSKNSNISDNSDHDGISITTNEIWRRKRWIGAFILINMLFNGILLWLRLSLIIQTFAMCASAISAVFYSSWINNRISNKDIDNWIQMVRKYLPKRADVINWLTLLFLAIFIAVKFAPRAEATALYDSSTHCVEVLKGSCKTRNSCLQSPLGMCSNGLVCCARPPDAQQPEGPTLPMPSAVMPIYDASCSGNVKTQLGNMWLYILREESVLAIVPQLKETFFDCARMHEVTPMIPMRARNISLALGKDAQKNIRIDSRGWILEGATGHILHPRHQLLIPASPYFMTVPRDALDVIWCGRLIDLIVTMSIEKDHGREVPAMVGDQSLPCEDSRIINHNHCNRLNYNLRMASYSATCLPDDRNKDTCPFSCYGGFDDTMSTDMFTQKHASDASNGLCLPPIQCTESGGNQALVEVSPGSCENGCRISRCCVFGKQDTITNIPNLPNSPPNTPFTDSPSSSPSSSSFAPSHSPSTSPYPSPSPSPSSSPIYHSPSTSSPYFNPSPNSTSKVPSGSQLSSPNNGDSGNENEAELGVFSGFDLLTICIAFLAVSCVICTGMVAFRVHRRKHWMSGREYYNAPDDDGILMQDKYNNWKHKAASAIFDEPSTNDGNEINKPDAENVFTKSLSRKHNLDSQKGAATINYEAKQDHQHANDETELIQQHSEEWTELETNLDPHLSKLPPPPSASESAALFD